MSKYKVDDTQLAAIAESIRTKTGSSDLLEFPDGFVSAVSGITAKIKQTSNKIEFSTQSQITVQPGKMVQLSSSAYVNNSNGPLQSFSFTPGFSGSANIEVYTKLIQGRNRYFAYNAGSSNVIIPAHTTFTCTHYLNSAYI